MGAGADPSPSPGVAVAAAAACDPARSPLRPSPPTPGVIAVVLGTLPSGGVARTPPRPRWMREATTRRAASQP